MDTARLDTAIAEARRFLKRANLLKDCLENSEAKHKDPKTGKTWSTYGYFPKEQGSARRASLDLTRSLADLRRPL